MAAMVVLTTFVNASMVGSHRCAWNYRQGEGSSPLGHLCWRPTINRPTAGAQTPPTLGPWHREWTAGTQTQKGTSWLKMLETPSLIWIQKPFCCDFHPTLSKICGESPKAKTQTHCNLVSIELLAQPRQCKTATYDMFQSCMTCTTPSLWPPWVHTYSFWENHLYPDQRHTSVYKKC